MGGTFTTSAVFRRLSWAGGTREGGRLSRTNGVGTLAPAHAAQPLLPPPPCRSLRFAQTFPVFAITSRKYEVVELCEIFGGRAGKVRLRVGAGAGTARRVALRCARLGARRAKRARMYHQPQHAL
jgi:hypothetical protein